jgi:DNA primase catalytic core
LETGKEQVMEIREIKSQLTIAQVLDHYNLKANKNGMLCCPFHNDKTPSLQIYPNTNTFCCFSPNCKAGTGDVIEFVRLMERCNKHEAILKAASLTGNHYTMNTETKTLSRQAVLTKYYQGSVETLASNRHAARAREYVKTRGLDTNRLSIGFGTARFDRDWSVVLLESAVSIGLLKKKGNSTYEPHFKDCLVFALKDKSGHIVDVYGRGLEKGHFYLSGNHQGLYPCYPKAETKKLILTEAIIDAATLQQVAAITSSYGILSCYGAKVFTAEHEQAIKELQQLDEVIFFFDGDKAGREGIQHIAEKIRQIKPQLKISCTDTPEGEDVNSLVQSHEAEILTHLIESRKTFSLSNEKEKTPTLNLTSHLNTENPELLFYQNGVLNVTVLGGIRITGLDKLRVTLKLESKTNNTLPLRHNLDLYHKGQTDQLVTQAAEHFDIGTGESTHAIAGLINALEKYRNDKLESIKPKKEERPHLSEAVKKETLDYLKKDKLMHRTLQDIIKTGIVGEQINSMIALLTYTSRKREKPLHLMCLGASGTGKTYLQERIGQLIPEEEKIEITMLSENAFYYFGKEELKHKLILIEDLDGAENVLYPLRELQSKTSISKTVTLKDSKGNLKTITLKVEGPVSVSSCTTREKIYEDNANRCILIYIDTTPEQDKRIMQYQQQYSAGLINQSEANAIKEKLKNVQRLLRPIKVRNPYAQHINLPEAVFKPRRTMLLLLSFIETITFYHQYQREVKQDPETNEPYIESTVQDVEYAFRLLKEILFSKSDELSGACRKFFEQLKAHLKKDKHESFYSSQVRKAMRMNPNNLKRYLFELVRYGLVKITGGSKYKGFEYKITDEKEYEQLKSSIDQQLETILRNIKAKQ